MGIDDKNFENIKYEDLLGILERHIGDGNDPYTEDQVLKIIRWIEETSVNSLLLDMILDGEIDIIFDEEIATKKDLGDNDLLFTLSKKRVSEMKSLGFNFENENEKKDISILKNLNLFSGGTIQ